MRAVNPLPQACKDEIQEFNSFIANLFLSELSSSLPGLIFRSITVVSKCCFPDRILKPKQYVAAPLHLKVNKSE